MPVAQTLAIHVNLVTSVPEEWAPSEASAKLELGHLVPEPNLVFPIDNGHLVLSVFHQIGIRLQAPTISVVDYSGAIPIRSEVASIASQIARIAAELSIQIPAYGWNAEIDFSNFDGNRLIGSLFDIEVAERRLGITADQQWAARRLELEQESDFSNRRTLILQRTEPWDRNLLRLLLNEHMDRPPRPDEMATEASDFGASIEQLIARFTE